MSRAHAARKPIRGAVSTRKDGREISSEALDVGFVMAVVTRFTASPQPVTKYDVRVHSNRLTNEHSAVCSLTGFIGDFPAISTANLQLFS